MATPEEIAPGFDYRPAWRLNDPEIERDAVHFWNRLAILPPGVAPERRAKELMGVAYKDEQIVGVQTAELGILQQVRARLAMIRNAVDPAVRRSHVSRALSVYTRDLMQRWSSEHPEERLAGLGALIESEELAGYGKKPWWPPAKFMLAGFTPDGRQIRISWFEDFRLG
jgi:hypothetical protein